MKKTTIILIFLSLFFTSQKAIAGPTPCIMPGCDDGCGTAKGTKIKRTYVHTKRNRTKINYKASTTVGVEITYQDFSNHMALGNKRTAFLLEEPVMMDIKNIDETGDDSQTWEMPNFNNYTTRQYAIEHVPLSATSLRDSFPNPTHATYVKDFIGDRDRYEAFQLTQDDLFYYGFGYQEKNGTLTDSFSYDLTVAPIPLKWGLEYTGTVTVVFTADPQIDSTQFVQNYDVVAHGILKTFDDGDVDAVKAIFAEKRFGYKDGVVIEEHTLEQILWYSTKGHVIRADIDDPWNSTGVVELKKMSYQKIKETTAGVNDEDLNAVKTFPNPIKAGQQLIIESKISLNTYFVDVYNVNGQKISNLNFSKSTNNQYKITIPENLSSGLYFYKVHDKKGSVLTNGKIQIQ
jgi:hypothetical protein